MNDPVFYISNARLPTDKAHGYQIARSVAELQRHGLSVTLLIPRRKNPLGSDIFGYYNLPDTVPTIRLWTIDIIRYWPRFGFWLQHVTFVGAVILFFIPRRPRHFLYGRDALGLLVAKLLNPNWPVAYEMHDFPQSHFWFWRIFLHRMNGVVVTNEWKRQQLITKWHIVPEKILVARNAIDPEVFFSEFPPSSNMPWKVGYLGQLKTKGMEKGVDVILQAAAGLPAVHFAFIGGTSADVAQYRKESERMKLKNVEFIGQISRAELPARMKELNAVVMPFPRTYHYEYIMSPVKMFEYMASHRPIIATRLTAITEVLNDANALLIEPDDVSALTNAIRRLARDSKFAQRIADQAFKDVQRYSWSNRSNALVQFLNRCAVHG